MRHIRRFLVAAFALALVFGASGGAAYAQTGVPGGPFASAFRIQNLGTATATCSYTMYKDDGTQAYAAATPLSINQNDSLQVLTTQVQGFPSGQFGGVVSCDQNVAVVVNWSDANKGDVYVASSTPTADLSAPSIYNNFFNYYTSIRVQNASGAAQDVTVEYYGASPTAVDSETFNLPVNGSRTVDQAGRAKLERNKNYSAKIKGAGPLAAVVSIYGGTGTSVANQLYSYAAVTGGSAQPTYAPAIFGNFFGYRTATTIQNVGTQPTDVQLTYSNGTTKKYSILNGGQKLAPNAVWNVLDFQDPSFAANTAYSSKIETLDAQPLIVTVNQSRITGSRAATYIGVSAGSTKVLAPTVFKSFARYNSGINCLNLGNAASDVKITYSGTSVTDKVVIAGLQPGKADLIYQPNEAGLPSGYVGSATITASQPIACLVSADRDSRADQLLNIDYFQTYNAIPQ
jgi:hypothetical protein